jgi:hypothetical protein
MTAFEKKDMHFGTVVHKNLKEDINTTINFI